MTIRDLLLFADAIAKKADAASEKFARGLQVVVRATERELRGVVTDASEGPASAILRSRRAAQARAAIRTALETGGFDALVDEATGGPLDSVTRAVLSLRTSDGTLITSDAFVTRVDALKALHGQDLLALGESLSQALWQATARGIFSGQSVARILADLAAVIDDTEAHLRTWYDTSVSIFGRQVEALQAGNDADTLFLYLGPDDAKTRPFCQRHVGRVYLRSEIDEMDNGQLDNPFLTGGGFNCRHSFIEIAKSSELADLQGTGERVPEIAQRMAA